MKKLLALALLVPAICFGDGFFGPYGTPVTYQLVAPYR